MRPAFMRKNGDTSRPLGTGWRSPSTSVLLRSVMAHLGPYVIKALWFPPPPTQVGADSDPKLKGNYSAGVTPPCEDLLSRRRYRNSGRCPPAPRPSSSYNRAPPSSYQVDKTDNRAPGQQSVTQPRGGYRGRTPQPAHPDPPRTRPTNSPSTWSQMLEPKWNKWRTKVFFSRPPNEIVLLPKMDSYGNSLNLAPRLFFSF